MCYLLAIDSSMASPWQKGGGYRYPKAEGRTRTYPEPEGWTYPQISSQKEIEEPLTLLGTVHDVVRVGFELLRTGKEHVGEVGEGKEVV